MNSDEPALPQPASAIQARAADFLVARSDRRRWTTADEAELDAWFAQSLAHQTAFWRLESIWGRADRLNALSPLTVQNRPVAPAPRRRSLFFGLAAAVAAVAAVGILSSLMMPRPQSAVYATPVGGHETVMLADGSRIELNTDTELRATIDAKRRAIELIKGEAFFQIKHNEARPFTVLAGQRRITDIGTKFYVRRDSGGFEVGLVEGRAELDATNKWAARPVVLMPGDVAKGEGSALMIHRKPVDSLIDELAWRHGVIVFTHATLAEAAAQFNRYNPEKIVITDTQTAALTIGGTFDADDVNAFTHLVRNLLGVKVEHRGNETVISR